MSQPPKFRAFLMKNPTTYYYRDVNRLIAAIDIVSTITSPVDYGDYALQSFPSNWADLEIGWSRNNTYLGIFRSASNNALQFVDDAAAICRYVYYRESYDGELYFKLEIRDDVTWEYSQLYYGRLNFLSAQDTLTEFLAEVDEVGLVQVVKAKEDTEFEIPIDPAAAEAVSVVIDGKMLQTNYRSNTASAFWKLPVPVPAAAAVPTIAIDHEGDYTIGVHQDQTARGMGAISATGPSIGISWAVDSIEHNNFMFMLDPEYFAPVTGEITAHHDVRYYSDTINPNPVYLEIWILICQSSTATPYYSQRIYYDQGTPIAPGTDKQVTVDATSFSFTLNPGDRLYYLAQLRDASTLDPAAGKFVYYGQQQISLLLDFLLKPTPANGFRYHEMAKRFVSAMTEGVYPFSSSFLQSTTPLHDSIPNQVVISSGDAVRNLFFNTSYIYTLPAARLTLKKIFQDCFGRWGCGLGIENDTLVIERLSHFFDDTTLITDLGEAIALTKAPLTDWLFTQFEVGFPDDSGDGINGKDSALLGTQYRIPLTLSTTKDQDFRTSFKAEPYVVEKLRANIADKQQNDTDNDDDIILLDIDTAQITVASDVYVNPNVTGGQFTGYKLRRPNTALNTSGILSPETAYNLSMTPARIARCLGSYIHSFLYLKDDRNVFYQTADKSKTANNLQSDLGSGNIVENADINVSDLDPILFKPFVFRITVPTPKNLAALMQTSPYGYFTTTYQGVPLRGFVLDVKFRPATLETTEWTLLATPSCDESLFYQP